MHPRGSVSQCLFFCWHTNFPRKFSRSLSRTPWRKRPKWHSMRPKGQEPARCHSPAGLGIPFKWAGILTESRFPRRIFAQMGGDDLVGCLLKKNLTKMIGISSEVKDTLLETYISPPKALLKMMFLFRKWDMLVPGGSESHSAMDWGDKKGDFKALLKTYPCLGGGFKYVFFSTLIGEMIQFDQYY